MNQMENITRDAARAIGLDARTWDWDEQLRGLRLVVFNNHDRTFAPLTNHSDAYKVENALLITVNYRAMGHGAYTLQVSAPGHAGSIMQAVTKGGDMLQARMYAITQFAALTALMEADND